MKIYIAGPMKNHPDYPAYFRAAQNRLEAQGLTVLNPATLPEGMEQADYMAICLAMVSLADVVALLPGWQHSHGARVELEVARYIGIPVAPLEQVLQGRVTA